MISLLPMCGKINTYTTRINPNPEILISYLRHVKNEKMGERKNNANKNFHSKTV